MNSIQNDTFEAGGISVPNNNGMAKNNVAGFKAPRSTPLPMMLATLALIGVTSVAVFEGVKIVELESRVKTQENEIKNKEDELTALRGNLGGAGEVKKAEKNVATSSKNYRIEEFEGNDYYIITGDYTGEYNLQFIKRNGADIDVGEYQTHKIMSLSEYSDFCKTWGLEQKYFDSSRSYAVLAYAMYGGFNIDVRLADVEVDGASVKFYVLDTVDDQSTNQAYLITVPVDSSATSLSVVGLLDDKAFDYMRKNNDALKNEIPVAE